MTEISKEEKKLDKDDIERLALNYARNNEIQLKISKQTFINISALQKHITQINYEQAGN